MSGQERPSASETSKKNARIATISLSVVVGMALFVFFGAAPAYRAFCQITGFDGSTGRANAGANEVLDRTITVRFDGTVSADLPWKFKPQQTSQSVKVGATNLAFFNAQNVSDHIVTGQAAFNVQPAKAGQYFRKIECFCFTKQTLKPFETATMPVTYFVDPKIADDHELDDVQTITLSYTFFEISEGGDGSGS